jgi:hypothetical protein
MQVLAPRTLDDCTVVIAGTKPVTINGRGPQESDGIATRVRIVGGRAR